MFITPLSCLHNFASLFGFCSFLGVMDLWLIVNLEELSSLRVPRLSPLFS